MRTRVLRTLTVVSFLAFTIAPASAQEPLTDLRIQIRLYQAAADDAPCELDWALLGGIAGFVSDHGRFDQPAPPSRNEMRTWLQDLYASRIAPVPGAERVPIRGDLLDGEAGRLLITDTDGGDIDGDAELDRAVGPFQFIPSTWALWATDADGDGVADPDDFEDAAAAAAAFLCDLGADVDVDRALTGYFGTDTWHGRVTDSMAAVRAYQRSLESRPASVSIAGPTTKNVDLITVGGIQVRDSIADDVAAMLEAAAADGIVLQGWGWRSHQRQIELRAAHCADIWETPPSQCSPPTAIPGTSMHEIGEAIDFYVTDGDQRRGLTRSMPEFAWLAEHAADFGFFNLASEPWHWSTNGR